jgi:amino acid transporter
LAEEVKDARRIVPRSILGAIGASMILYVGVVSAAVLADSPAGNPLLSLFDDHAASVFAAVAALAIANGVLIEIVMLARLFYGMARNRQLPAMLGHVHPRTQTPARATALAGAIVLATALLVPFERLLALTSLVTLAVFALVDLALWRVQRTRASPEYGFRVPRSVPLLATALCLALIAAGLLN